MIAEGLAAIGGGIAIGTAENARSEEVIADRTDVVDAPPDAGAAALAQWQRRVSDLGQQRDLALVTGDRSHLTRVNAPGSAHRPPRSEEHTSELQSRGHLVCRLLLEKKKEHTRQR